MQSYRFYLTVAGRNMRPLFVEEGQEGKKTMILFFVGLLAILMLPIVILQVIKSNKAKKRAYEILDNNSPTSTLEIVKIIQHLRYDRYNTEKRILINKLMNKK